MVFLELPELLIGVTRVQLQGAAVRTVGYTMAALISGALMHEVAGIWWFAVKVGIVTGLVTALGISVVPIIEYYADSLPERRLGVFGIFLILSGFRPAVGPVLACLV